MLDNLSNLNLGKFLGRDGKGSLRERVANNERKITLLKNIIKAPKAIDDQYKGIGKSPIEPLEDIHTALDDLLETIRGDKKLQDQKAEYERLKLEKEKRDAQRKKLQKERWEKVKNISNKILAPFKGIWNKIWGFISTILLGSVLLMIVNWIGNPLNRDKLESTFRFFKDWWPLMLGAYILFGTAFTGMVAGILKVIGWGVVKLVGLIPLLKAALIKLKAAKLLKLIPGAGILKGLIPATLAVGGSALMIKAATGEATGEPINPTGSAAGMNTDQRTERLQNIKEGGATKEAIKSVNMPSFMGLNQGGHVPGTGNKDTVPAMLTPGEFVMSRGAVDKFGAEFMEGINAFGGGTNVPTNTIVDNSRYYHGGGRVSLPSFFVKKDVVQNFQGGGEVQPKWTANSMKLAPSDVKIKEITPPLSSMSSVVAYNKQRNEQRQGKLDTQGDKIPEFDAEVWLSQIPHKDKIEVLGISL